MEFYRCCCCSRCSFDFVIGKIELNLEGSRDGGELSHFSSSHKGRPESDRKATGKVYYKGDRKVDYKAIEKLTTNVHQHISRRQTREAKENKS